VGALPPGRLLVSDAAGAGEELLEVAIDAARMAGGLLLARARTGLEKDVSSKSTPTDLVSEADLAAERAIRELLGRRRPEDTFVGEEGGIAEGAGPLSWVVDPLDGTINFLFGVPQWCVSVAVRDGAGTLAGAVFDPNRDELFTATRGGRPMLTGPAGTVELAGPAGTWPYGSAAAAGAGSSEGVAAAQPGVGDLASALVATGLAYDARVREAQAKVLARLAPRVRDIRRFGSAALDLCWTAAGRFDAYFERSVKQWDVAAGALICERAGLRVCELASFEHLPWGILVAAPALADPLLELVAGP
jgi:myo-inositol-1(or 4)-monophosphatase